MRLESGRKAQVCYLSSKTGRSNCFDPRRLSRLRALPKPVFAGELKFNVGGYAKLLYAALEVHQASSARVRSSKVPE